MRERVDGACVLHIGVVRCTDGVDDLLCGGANSMREQLDDVVLRVRLSSLPREGLAVVVPRADGARKTLAISSSWIRRLVWSILEFMFPIAVSSLI